MDDYKEIFKREYERLNYLYAKANTKSKKRQLAYDLIFFENMYNSFVTDDDRVVFPWSYDEELKKVSYEGVEAFVTSILLEQHFLIELVENSFNIFLDEEFSTYCDYGKNFHKLKEELFQKYIFKFYSSFDKDIGLRIKDKFINLEIFINNNIKKYNGLFFPMESLNKNIILFTSRDIMTVDESRSLVHELGHDFEFMNARESGETNIWSKIEKTIYSEVSSSFFEYAFINYLIDNNFYLEDAMIMKRRYLNQIFYFLAYLLIIFSQSELTVDNDLNMELKNEEIVQYANSLFEYMNSSESRFSVGEKISFQRVFIYCFGKLLGIYVYDTYKKNPREFLVNFKTMLLQYKDIGIDAFEYLGITKDMLLDGKVLKRTLKESKKI